MRKITIVYSEKKPDLLIKICIEIGNAILFMEPTPGYAPTADFQKADAILQILAESKSRLIEK